MVLKVSGRTNTPAEMTDDAAVVETVAQTAEVGQEVLEGTVVDSEDSVGSAGVDQGAEAEVETQAEAEVDTQAQAEAAVEAELEQEEPEHVVEEEAGEKATADNTASESVTAVATLDRSTAIVIPREPGAAENFFKNMIDELIGDGQEGLEMGYGVFPVISLDKGEFKVGDMDVGDDDFEGVPLMSKPKYAYRQTNVPEKEAEVLFADSDRAHLEEGGAVAERLAEWRVKFPESSFDIKKYQDVFLYLTRFPGNPVLEGQLVQLSVAPTSVKVYTRACLTAKGKGRSPHETVFKIGVGDKIRGEFDYYPWSFECIGSCKKLGVEVSFGTKVDEDF